MVDPGLLMNYAARLYSVSGFLTVQSVAVWMRLEQDLIRLRHLQISTFHFLLVHVSKARGVLGGVKVIAWRCSVAIMEARDLYSAEFLMLQM